VWKCAPDDADATNIVDACIAYPRKNVRDGKSRADDLIFTVRAVDYVFRAPPNHTD
jgi:DNA-binding response OmpR family regulator